MKYREFLISTLQKSSEIANRNFGKVSGTPKKGDNNQVLTETDLEIGKFIIEQIKGKYPTHNIIDEEAGAIDNGSEYTWVVDPIDGTSNFANGIPTYGIMIGLLEESSPTAGAVSLPFFEEIYIAEKGQGTFCNDVKIKTTNETNLLSTLVAYTIDGHQENPEDTRNEAKLIGEIVLGIRNLRASGSCFDAVMVVKGKYGGYVNQTSKIWDNVAQQILIEEAGGIYTDFFGRPIDYSSPLSRVDHNFTFCGAAPGLHKQLQKIIRRATSGL